MESKFAEVSSFLRLYPELAPKPAKGDLFDSSEYWLKLQSKFDSGRQPRSPKAPSTVPDHLVSLILESYFKEESQSLEEIKRTHSLSMAAENVVGDFLERYIAHKLEPHGWVWCSGETVQKVDFIKLISNSPLSYLALQVKNRNNSENSSSSSVRDETEIIKWFRTFSKSGKTNWAKFPNIGEMPALSEEEFIEFTLEYIKKLEPPTSSLGESPIP